MFSWCRLKRVGEKTSRNSKESGREQRQAKKGGASDVSTSIVLTRGSPYVNISKKMLLRTPRVIGESNPEKKKTFRE